MVKTPRLNLRLIAEAREEGLRGSQSLRSEMAFVEAFGTRDPYSEIDRFMREAPRGR